MYPVLYFEQSLLRKICPPFDFLAIHGRPINNNR